MYNEVVMMVGSPASGKGRMAAPYVSNNYLHLNRDLAGGNVADLLPMLESALKDKRNVVLDNTYPTAEKRRPFVEMARKHKVPIRCVHVTTSTEDCAINALMRMWDRYEKLFMTPESLKEVKGDPNMFPIAVLFAYKKDFQEPKMEEGFSKVEMVPFKRAWPKGLTHKALMLDYDDTLRTVKPGSKYKFPTKPSEVELLPNRAKVLKAYKDRGYVLLGASNQSGIARKQLSESDAELCFRKTNEMLGLDIKAAFCPHNVPPTCYCRKPQSGLGVKWIREWKLDPPSVIYVGDQTTDKTFATRLGFQYADQAGFFK